MPGFLISCTRMGEILKYHINHFKQLIGTRKNIAAFTGAGISTESGISDYRSQGGLWQKYQPVTFQEFVESEEQRIEYWRRKKETYASMRDAEPNAGHKTLAALEEKGILKGIITQNIDGLHQKAGSRNVLEIHGTNMETLCLSCGKVEPFDLAYERLLQGETAPLCLTCGGLLKPNTISFGQNLDPDILGRSIRLAKSCDLMICIGSTLIVEPAASLPVTAKNYGAALVIINREPTPLDGIADLAVHTGIGDFLPHAL